MVPKVCTLKKKARQNGDAIAGPLTVSKAFGPQKT